LVVSGSCGQPVEKPAAVGGLNRTHRLKETLTPARLSSTGETHTDTANKSLREKTLGNFHHHGFEKFAEHREG
jgi:hypothetical protein